MRFALSAVAFLLFGLAVQADAYAQATPPAGPGRILGQISNAEGLPLPAAGITIRSAADSSILTGVLTEKDGRFRVEGLPLGGYIVRVSLLGYKTRSSDVVTLSADKAIYDFGPIKLEVAAVQLDAIQAVAERSAVVVEADRTVYSTKAMPVAATGTATDVLRAVPELEVDVNDNVKLRGNMTVAVHINGRPAPMRGEQLANFLKQLRGDRIERVEVMPNPSAKHDPEGMGGIVNIVLKENVDLGLSGNLSTNVSTRNQRGGYGRINYQKGRLTLFTGAGVSMHQQLGSTYDLRQNLLAQPLTAIEQNNTNDNSSRGGNLDWTAELKVGKQATLWSNAWMYFNSSDNSGLQRYGILDEFMTARDRYDRLSSNDVFWGDVNVGLGFKQIFQQQKHELTIDGRFSRGDNTTDSRLTKDYLLANGVDVDLPIELTLNDVDSFTGGLWLQADYFRPLGKGRIDVGYRAWKRDNDYDNHLRIMATEDALDAREQSRSGYEFDETFHSLYVTTSRTMGKVAVNVGVRAELASTRFFSLVTGDEFDRNYNTVFPSFNISYTPKPGRTARLVYSKRISRPSPHYINPFVPSTDPLNLNIGNSDLAPSHTHSFSLDLTYTGQRGTIRLAPYYRGSVDVWERIRTVDALGVATNRWENAASNENFGSTLSLSLRPSGRLSGSGNFTVWRDLRDGSNISAAYRRGSTMWSVGGYFGFKATPTLTASLNTSYYPAQNILQGRASGYTYMGVGLRQQVWGTKGSISVNVNDPLSLYRYNSDTRDATYIQTSRSNYKSRTASIGFTYNFGKPPQQQSRRSADEGGGGDPIRVR